MVRLLHLRDAGAVLRGAVLPAGQRHRGAALAQLRDLRRRLPGPPVRRARLRPHRRSGRPQVHVPRHHRGDGPVDRRRSACCRPTRPIGMLAPDPAGAAAACAGPGARRRVRRRGDLRRRARPRRASAALHTSWIQTTATLGFFLSLVVIGVCRAQASKSQAFKSWGWRIPFLVSLVLLGISIYIRLKLNESPVSRA